jgi:predicted nucleic acid-binding protein
MLREFEPVVWWGSRVEIVSALSRLRREAALTARRFEIARTRLELLSRAWRELQPVVEVRESAEELLARYDLRAPDALQLAAALVWCDHRPSLRHFVCLDKRLCEAARGEGFNVLGI